MTYFPVSHSNLSAAHLGLFLKDKYLTEYDINCKLIRSGINDTYLVSMPDEKYVFRVYSLNWRTLTEIKEEIRLLNLLKDNNISVSYPITDRDNNYIQTLQAPEGDRFGVLFSFAEGRKFHDYSEETHYRIGSLMAQIHRLTNNLKLERVTYTPEVLLIDSLKNISEFLDDETSEMDFMKSAQKNLLNILKNARTENIRHGAVHLDMWFENMNVTADNKITVFDFDFCGNGWLCLDLAFYIMQIYNLEKYVETKYQPKVESFIKGYESITKISDEEKKLIPALGICLYFFYLGVQCCRFDNWSNSFLSENYLKRYINGLVKRYYEINEPGE